MASRNPGPASGALELEFPQSLGVYDSYADAQRAVDHLSDEEFPVQHCMIVGTELKQIERVTGRLTWNRVALGGLGSGAWLGVFIGLVLALFGEQQIWRIVLSAALIGALFGLVWALVGYGLSRGRRDFSSVRQVVATKYEVLVEHKHWMQARELLGNLAGRPPGQQSDPFA